MSPSKKKESKRSCSVVLSNLPSDTTTYGIKEFLNQTGPLLRCFLVRDKDFNFGGMAYVTFTSMDDAEKSLSLDNSSYNGNVINVERSKSKEKKKMKRPPVTESTNRDGDSSNNIPPNDYRNSGSSDNVPPNSYRNSGSSDNVPPNDYRNFKKFHDFSTGIDKKGRIVIRNLSFQCTEGNLHNFFGPFGEIKEVNLLRNENGILKGVAFIQYGSKECAENAISGRNMQKFMGRTIAVDWSVQKAKYGRFQEKFKKEKKEVTPHNSFFSSQLEEPVKEENENNDSFCDTKSEPEDELDLSNVKTEDEYHNEEGIKKEEDIGDGRREVKKEKADHQPESKDVTMKKTLFVRSIAFNSTEGAVEDFFRRFGPIIRVAFCKDAISQRFKGSAFVQFAQADDAKKCLEAYEDPAYSRSFILDERKLHVCIACSRDDAKSLQQSHVPDEKKPEKKDKRNLYLAKEGFIKEGSKAAEEVSKGDMEMRKKLKMLQKKTLQNLHYFISPIRLCVHNLPGSIDDKKLKNIFKEHSPKGSIITECKVMKDFHNVDMDGKPVSKGHAFVSFKRHQDALEALRHVNNNPEVFTLRRRAIVEFSIENKAALLARERRLKRSLEKNPTSSQYIKPEDREENIKENQNDRNLNKKNDRNFNKKNDRNFNKKPTFSGKMTRTLRGKSKNADKDKSKFKITRNQVNKMSKKKFKNKKGSSKNVTSTGGSNKRKHNQFGGSAKKKQKQN